jgi:hypothetical protein
VASTLLSVSKWPWIGHDRPLVFTSAGVPDQSLRPNGADFRRADENPQGNPVFYAFSKEK